MANITECDGCGTRISDRPGETPPGMEGNRADDFGRLKGRPGGATRFR